MPEPHFPAAPGIVLLQLRHPIKTSEVNPNGPTASIVCHGVIAPSLPDVPVSLLAGTPGHCFSSVEKGTLEK